MEGLGFFNSKDDTHRLLRSFAQSLRQYPLLCLGFGIWWTWVILIYQSSAIFPEIMLFGDEGILIPSCIGPIAAIAATLLLMAVIYRRKRFILRGKRYFARIAAFMTMGAVFVVAWREAGTDAVWCDVLLYAVSSTVLGCSSAFMYTEFNRALGWLGMLGTLFMSMVSVLVGSLIMAVCNTVPEPMKFALFIFMPALMATSLFSFARRFPSKEYFGHGNESDLRIPAKFIATSFAEGLTYGIVFGGLTIGSGVSFHTEATLISNACAIGVLMVSTFVFKFDFNRLIYQVGFPLMAFGVLLIGVFPESAGAGSVMHAVGYGFTDFILWALGSYLIKNAGLPAVWITACPSGSLFLGLSVGVVSGCALQEIAGDFPRFAGVYACALVFLSLVFSNNRNVEYGWGTIRPMSAADDDRRKEALMRCCEFLANEHGLTRREQDITMLLLQKKSRKAIAEELYVSENTVKTHVRNIYRKLGVKSQEELVNAAEHAGNLINADDG